MKRFNKFTHPFIKEIWTKRDYIYLFIIFVLLLTRVDFRIDFFERGYVDKVSRGLPIKLEPINTPVAYEKNFPKKDIVEIDIPDNKNTTVIEVFDHIEKLDPKRYEYVSRYYELAKAEEAFKGIPASIILSQGILESAAGESKLCIANNNHFGVKYYGMSYIPAAIRGSIEGFSYAHDDCKPSHYWSHSERKGQFTVKKGTDAFLICPKPDRYVKYKSAWASYRHHSYVVTKKRYTKYRPKTFNDWAWAFKFDKGGYATDKKYHEKLIRIIKKFRLNDLDDPRK